MTAKLIKCKTCGSDMAANANLCPQCGAKNKKPFYRKWWFWVILVLFLIGVAGGGAEDTDTSSTEGSAAAASIQKEPAKEDAEKPVGISYTHYDVTELFDILSSNALKAEKTFQDQYVEIEGYLTVIDSDGNYIGVGAHSGQYQYILQNVQCYIKGKDQLAQVMEMSIGDPITVRGKIKDIGEVMGYSMNIDSIN